MTMLDNVHKKWHDIIMEQMRDAAATVTWMNGFCELDDAMLDDISSMESCTPTCGSVTVENALDVAVLGLTKEGDTVTSEHEERESASVEEEPTPLCLSKFIDCADAL